MSVGKYDVEAAHVINAYFWDKLRVELEDDWELIPHLGVPIIPAQQQPEATESGKNYMTYIYSDHATRDLYIYESQDVSWVIFSPSSRTIRRTIALARDLFGKWDESAQEVNEWMRDFDFPSAAEEFYKRYVFKSITITGTTSSQPATDEGGTKDGLISVNYQFVQLDT